MVDEDTTHHTQMTNMSTIIDSGQEKKHIDLKTGLSYYGFSN